MDTPEKKPILSLSETMEKYSHIEGSTPREKLRNAYAQLRAKTNPGPDTSATPSSAGDIEPSAPVSLPETAAPLSVRVDKEPTHHTDSEANPTPTMPTVEPVEMGPPQHDVQTIHPSALSVNYAEEPTPGSVHLGPSEFAVPLPMDSRIKDDYERVLTSESQSIRDFLGMAATQSDPEQQRGPLLSKMHEILERLGNISTHPDLNIVDHIKDSESELGREAAWAEYSSAKFLLLSYLLDAASMRDIHLVIMVQSEKTQRVVERYFMGKGLSYTRPRLEMGAGTNIEVSMVKDSLSFGIQTTRNDGIVETYKAPAAIIALDTSFNTKSPTVEHMRTTFARNGNLLPVIRLLVSNSSEHIELCFPGLPETERVRLLLQYSIRLRDAVGDLQDDALGVQEDAEELLSCLDSGNFSAHWPLPHIEPICILSPEQLESTQQELQSRPGIDIPSVTPQVQKRAFAEDGTEQSVKRMRTEESLETSQFTESTKFPSQTLDGELRSLERNLVQMKSSHVTEIERLQKLLTATQTRLQERESVLDKLQHRYETRNREFHKLRREHERLTQAKATTDQRVEKQKEELMKLKDERTQLRHDLDEARETIKAGGGSTAELESAKEDIRRLTKDNAALERKADYEARQAEYTREQYQTASTVAAQSGNELRQLRDENESLKRKVAGDATHLRELNQKNDEARHLSRVLELEATLTSREDLLRRKEEELREIRKNRPSTRSTSTQPRSPKWTAGNSRPTSPGINNGSSLAGRGSALRFSSEMPL
ncbi:HDA1 complex subunit [Aspergillus sclerotiicarbonarius CBS 121057]|uniref:HDA1 complex subunit n=1 Tax=Aspergillus sclerotiicarbonarius (strain CBS 121057 / IBT 28362) TaxID=1448318 RepID=A0A319EW66_ASPSB|nr:HDA1 complex subunit [Aspergillus sclerotiicarbonarius CBS 121057]